ncbi:MAG: peroxiredoxin-like family protein [Saprospiraceae bacterium]
MIETDLDVLEEMVTNSGDSLKALSFQSPVLLMFLRHFGCVFCKEALADIADKRKSFEKSGIHIVFVHMADDATAIEYFHKFNLDGITFVCDPTQRFYAAFGLHRGTFTQLYGLHTWMRGYKLKAQKGYELELAKKLGDSTQMPGVFVLQDGEIKDRFIHRHAAERPDYDRLIQCCVM